MLLLKSLFPSMFHRRLLLLAAAAAFAAVPIALQLSRLTLSRGDQLRLDAEAKLIRRQWTPTVRGSIFDRKGRVLAQDRPSYDVVVAYSVITGDWTREMANTAARRTYGRTGWIELKAHEREEAIAKLLPIYQIHLEKGWNALAATLGVQRADLDAKRDAVMRELNQRQESITQARFKKEFEDTQERKQTITPDDVKAMEKRAAAPIAEFTQSHLLAGRIGDDLGFACGNIASEEVTPDPIDMGNGLLSATWPVPIMPGLSIRDSGDRDYPYEAVEIAVNRRTLPTPVKADDDLTIAVDGVACHILGRLRDRVFGDKAQTPDNPFVPGDQTRREAYLDLNPTDKSAAMTPDHQDRGTYRDGDRVGDTGVENSQEQTLRGLRGMATTRLDTGEKDYLAAAKGRDVSLTLDIMLQARVQAAMSKELGLAVVQPWHLQESTTQLPGEVLNGAAVVLDIDTGEILAMVSTPTFTRTQLKEDPDSIYNDKVNTPFVNRCVGKPYPPGSIVKPAVLAGAVTMGNYKPEERIACTGHLLPDKPNILRCLIYKKYHTTHSVVLGRDINGTDAVMQSCNIFFFNMGRRLGPQALCSVYSEFGVGQPFNLGIGGEFPGQLGKFNTGADLIPADAIQMAIGQGPISWTPLHAADTYATLARGGTRLPPRLIKGRPRAEARDLGLDPRGIAIGLEGLDLAVNSDLGTGQHLTFDDKREPIFNAPGVHVWGKTGTATAPDILSDDPDGKSGPEKGDVLETGDHSWFVILAGPDKHPRYAIAVIIDYGGSGGKVSGPIANQILHALIAEGYL